MFMASRSEIESGARPFAPDKAKGIIVNPKVDGEGTTGLRVEIPLKGVKAVEPMPVFSFQSDKSGGGYDLSLDGIKGRGLSLSGVIESSSPGPGCGSPDTTSECVVSQNYCPGSDQCGDVTNNCTDKCK